MPSSVEVVSSEEYAGMSPKQKANAITVEQRMADIAADEKAEAEERERKKRSPFKKWGQVNLDDNAYTARIQLIKASPVAAQIWEFLSARATTDNAVICSVKAFEEALGYTKQSITKALKVLRDMQFVEVRKSGVTNIYFLNSELIWKTWGTGYEYAEFHADVVISRSEQKKITKARSKRMNVVECRKEDSQPRGKDSQQPEEAEWEDSLPDEGEPPEE